MGLTRRKFVRDVLAGGATLALTGFRNRNSAAYPGGRTPPQPPNLLIVYPDQMRGQAMGFLGEEPVLTPRLDRFAKESVVFTQAVSNYPVCSPSRAMLMTGKYPHSNGVLGNCNTSGSRHGYELRTDETCWSDVLKVLGYDLGYIGKWHLDSPHKPYVKSGNNTEEFAWNEWTPPERRHGFDFWYAYGTFDQHLTPMYWDTAAPRDGAHTIEMWGPVHEADLAIRYIRNERGRFRSSGKPFALVVAMNPPHMPYDLVPPEYVERYAGMSLEDLCRRPNIPAAGTEWGDYFRKHIRNYYAMITGVDEQFGRILDALEKAGLAEDTIVVFLSDHGNCLGIHDEISKNNYYEESMRIPLLVRWPGGIEARKEDLLLSVPDIYPTLLDLMGLRRSLPKTVEGKSHADWLGSRNAKVPRPTSQLYIWTPYGEPDMGRRGVRTLTHTLVISQKEEKPDDVLLFDRGKDPFQLKNIADDEPDLVRELMATELLPWLERTKDPFRKRISTQ